MPDTENITITKIKNGYIVTNGYYVQIYCASLAQVNKQLKLIFIVPEEEELPWTVTV